MMMLFVGSLLFMYWILPVLLEMWLMGDRDDMSLDPHEN